MEIRGHCLSYARHQQEWHCTLRGTPGTEFEGGLYHFRILLPSEYPFRPPSIMMLTPNGRFELNTKVNILAACSSYVSYIYAHDFVRYVSALRIVSAYLGFHVLY